MTIWKEGMCVVVGRWVYALCFQWTLGQRRGSGRYVGRYLRKMVIGEDGGTYSSSAGAVRPIREIHRAQSRFFPMSIGSKTGAAGQSGSQGLPAVPCTGRFPRRGDANTSRTC
ncbi:hypothetical protein BD626DRAFT_519517 [Schizophyllum amplum]|uniref:Secreted protein n=1 Tax=Schizophyllum amplum TaxID=97359 RepID=A0A550BV59_9AGAR|nr:hypothetical protein BD626DRAFT_519517 [Auriculariopsis ampla]